VRVCLRTTPAIPLRMWLQVCPFYATRELATQAHIVFMPYNYVTDENANLEKLLAGRVLILDEAHNVESVCQDTASFDLSSGAYVNFYFSFESLR
jgi:Rad3-related DNA helicase